MQIEQYDLLAPELSLGARGETLLARPAQRRALQWLVLALSLLGFCVALGRLEYALVGLAAPRVETLGLSRAGLELSLLAPILILAPALVGLRRLLHRWQLRPTLAARVGLAFVLFALACFCLGVGIEWSLAQEFVGLGAIGACAVVASLAALCMGPASLAFSARIEGRIASVGLWLIGYPLGRALGASTTAVDALFEACLSQGLAAVAVAVILMFSWRSFAAMSEGPGRWRAVAAASSRRSALRSHASTPDRARTA